MTPSLPHQSINIAGVSIAMDQAGRYCLNDLHKAACNEPRHQPAFFLRRPETSELIDAISNSAPAQSFDPVDSTPGRHGGTFACRELVYAYAMWISPSFHLKVIRTFDAVATSQTPAPPAKPALQLAAPARELRAALSIAKMLGLTGNQAILSANRVVTNITGVDLMQTMDVTHLVTPTQEICYTPTELGSRLCLSAKSFNRRLEERGMQERQGQHWVPTDKGKKFAVVLDTGKAHSNGAPIQQVKWTDRVMEEVAS